MPDFSLAFGTPTSTIVVVLTITFVIAAIYVTICQAKSGA